ncbi:uncharacterized protein YegL [Tibeticola sediminis]|uniref:Uncharacterized protein YegL n=1 Tax=Tibeticola sediminis TaxID=1917811 RepID=A0A3N4TX62_9BURK|nr:VWA domain-containing protein [Tibeticola sediminis]RPE63042.1 uncharacterized protein YegL [Tibeticola sediminis]
MTDSHNDLIDNPSPRCPVALVLDTSGSMDGEPIRELNAGIQLFIDEVKSDDLARWSVDLAVYTAGGSADCIQSFIGVEQIAGFATLHASGSTPLGQAVRMALDDLAARKKSYRDAGVPYYQPWLVLISDGAPTDAWQDAARRARDLSEQRKLVSLPIGVQGADLGVLSQFSSKPAVALDGLKFRELFQWLSASMARVSASTSSDASVQLPSMDGWGSI